jgi:hypothetical protein
MTVRRRLTLQLTPLLDLLLIVMFAQYMEVQIVAKREADRVASERDATLEENDELRRQVARWEAEQKKVDRDQHREREQIGQLIREVFRLPNETVNKVVQPRSAGEAGLSPSELAELKAQIHQLATARGDRVVDHLLTFNEMRKQFDIWELYLNQEGELLISISGNPQQFKSKVIETPEAFIDTMLAVREKFPPTKSTVLILCRYGDCRLVNKIAMTRGLPAMAERIQSEGRESVRFEFAIFGYRPQPELDQR